MRRRDHPQVGDIWATWDKNIHFVVLEKKQNNQYNGWDLVMLVNGQIEEAFLDKDFSQLDGVYWKLT